MANINISFQKLVQQYSILLEKKEEQIQFLEQKLAESIEKLEESISINQYTELTKKYDELFESNQQLKKLLQQNKTEEFIVLKNKYDNLYERHAEIKEAYVECERENKKYQQDIDELNKYINSQCQIIENNDKTIIKEKLTHNSLNNKYNTKINGEVLKELYGNDMHSVRDKIKVYPFYLNYLI